MNMQLTTDQISRALFENDPMNTCCKENDCFDEYDRVAVDVAQCLEAGSTLKDALAGAINEWFYDGEDMPKSESIVEPTIVWLEQAGAP
ncbi:hypothetical protein SAMN04488490_0432 [Marinobacter sp. LV10R510-11A]|uniref:hypothetical protein n=1 Tax=Marinobacter sp. LV10R510-11A TaxID=1415568 RepID=UPI000BB7F534|nr:hypothetical protein [Marinobacter sp. LV10R510-11A]SOB74892.1 hypothetical protein SAMN04488490_0432 [Marinobacter sp. LV10R510-11A]